MIDWLADWLARLDPVSMTLQVMTSSPTTPTLNQSDHRKSRLVCTVLPSQLWLYSAQFCILIMLGMHGWLAQTPAKANSQHTKWALENTLATQEYETRQLGAVAMSQSERNLVTFCAWYKMGHWWLCEHDERGPAEQYSGWPYWGGLVKSITQLR